RQAGCDQGFVLIVGPPRPTPGLRSRWRAGLAKHGDEAAAPLHVGGCADVVGGAGTGLDQPPGSGNGCGLGIVAHDYQGWLDALQARGDDGLAAFRWKDAGIALELWDPLAIGVAIAIIDLLALFEADTI